MSKSAPVREVWTEMELRLSYPFQTGRLARILETLRRSGGKLLAYLVYRLEADTVGLFVCENPTEAALALEEDSEEGLTVETETVVVVCTEERSGAVGHLVRVLEAEGIEISYSYATSSPSRSEPLCLVFRTDDNPKAEDVLKSYLILPDET